MIMTKTMTKEESAKLDKVVRSVRLSVAQGELKNWLWYGDDSESTDSEVWAIFYPVLGDPSDYPHTGEFCARLDRALMGDEARLRG